MIMTGTSPVDGISILATVIKHFITHKAKAVFVLHLTEILNPAIIESQTQITTFRMEMYAADPRVSGGAERQVDALNTAEELRREYEEAHAMQLLLPLYKLKVGVSKSSEGIPCAASAGE